MKTLVASLALASIAVPASAEENEFRVAYADLDLSTAEGQAALDERIEDAAREYCGAATISTGTRLSSAKKRACVSTMTAKAKQQFAAIIRDQEKGG